MKMSDVFALPMTQGITCVMSKDHRHEIVFDESDSNISDQIEHVAHAINNHDRMVEEIAELREFVCSLQLDVSNEIKLENLLAKPNQEGEE